MNLSDFMARWNGKMIPSRGGILGECVSLTQAWAEVNGVTGTPVFPVAAAKDMVNSRPDFFTWIANTPTGVPSAGDIIVWNTQVGKWGHTAVFINGNSTTFNSFDQNWPIGSPAHTQAHNYNGVVGWLRLKGNTQGGDMPTKVNTNTLRVIHTEEEGWPLVETHRGDFDAQFAAAWGGQDLEAVMLDKFYKNDAFRGLRVNAIDYYQNKRPGLEAQLKGQQDQIATATTRLATAQKRIDELTAQLGVPPVVIPVIPPTSVPTPPSESQASFWKRIGDTLYKLIIGVK